MVSALGSNRPSPYAVAGGGPTPTPPVLAPSSATASTAASVSVASSGSAVGVQSFGLTGFLGTVFSFLGNVFSGVVNFFKGLWNKLFGGTQSTQPLDSTSAQVAQQYGLLPTEANVQAFLVEARSYEQNGTLGPGSPPSNAIQQIQQALASWGYQVTPSGTWDQATSSAVIGFKQKYGIHQTYQMADGTWAVNAYVDDNTLAAMRQLMAGQTPTVSNPSTSTGSTQPSQSTTQPVQGVSNWQAIAQQYGLQANSANVQAFLTEVQGYQSGGALGPGSNDTADIKQMQQLLVHLGYSSVSPSGTWDAATSQAVIAFKTKNGLHQTYKAADGNWAINEYADATTLKLMMQQAGQPAA